jgi:ABC-type transporter lipoprotein component MlaA
VKKLQEETDYSIDTSDIEDAVYQIAQEGCNTKLVSILEKTLHKLSNRDFIKFDEKYVKLILFAYCILRDVYLVKSEYEVEDFQKEGQNLIEKKKQDGIEQIKKYNTSQELLELQILRSGCWCFRELLVL